MILDALTLTTGDEVLVSAYNCGTEVDALLAAGLKVRCVDCDSRGFLTFDALKNAVGPSTRAIYAIHPFGWPQPLDEIDEIVADDIWPVFAVLVINGLAIDLNTWIRIPRRTTG